MVHWRRFEHKVAEASTILVNYRKNQNWRVGALTRENCQKIQKRQRRNGAGAHATEKKVKMAHFSPKKRQQATKNHTLKSLLFHLSIPCQEN